MPVEEVLVPMNRLKREQEAKRIRTMILGIIDGFRMGEKCNRERYPAYGCLVDHTGMTPHEWQPPPTREHELSKDCWCGPTVEQP